MPQRHPLRYNIIILIGLTVVAIGACQAPPSPGGPSMSELSDSVWPFVDDALDPDHVYDAAHTLITRYLSTTDTITRDGGEGNARMAALVTPTWLSVEDTAFAHYRTEHLRTIGDTTFDSLVIQSASDSVTGAIHVDAFACVDASWVWLVPREAPDPPDGLIDWLRSGEDAGDVTDEEFTQWSQYLDEVQPIPGERQAIVLWLVGHSLSSLAVDGTVNWEGAHQCHVTVTD
jgi:hypothetical protein